jgi:heme oxygenase (biliverdin-IX-beta and delta-forming)
LDTATELLTLLRAASGASHETLDQTVTKLDPFANVERYGRFVLIQYDLYARINPLFSRSDLLAIFPDLRMRNRISAIAQDLADIGLVAPPISGSALADADVATALGWLYVAEGSNLGAAVLLKQATQIGMSETFGARHLAGHAKGRGLHWRTFTTALNAAALTTAQKQRAAKGAIVAFDFVRSRVEVRLPAQLPLDGSDIQIAG